MFETRSSIKLVVVIAFSTGCSLKSIVHDRFVKDRSCEPSMLRERPDLPAPKGSQGFELTGCGRHDLYVCSNGGTDANNVYYPPDCNVIPWCETAGCSSDFSTVARQDFAQLISCPADRVTTTPTRSLPAAAPAEIAADPARLAMWTKAREDAIAAQESQGNSLVTAQGCDTARIFACWKQPPGLPHCGEIKLGN
jgi:hypothetical protein